MAKEDRAQRLDFLELGNEERSYLAALRPMLEQRADTLVGAFYRHLLSFEQTQRLLRDPAVKERLLQKQRLYLLSLGSPQYDDEFFAERIAIGETHERIGLEPRWYLGAYAIYFSLLAPAIVEIYRSEPHHAERTLSALVKQLLLDAQLAMEAYLGRHSQELGYLNRELATAGQQLAREVEDQRVELRETERRARAAEELASLATLVTGLAHEIGTPMGVMQGHAEMLESSVGDERGRWRLRMIREQIDRISRLIQTLLSAARPREPVRIPISVAAVLDNSLSFLAENFHRRGIEVERRFSPTPEISGDAEKLQQLFLNLLLNAVDAMPQGGTIVVTLTKQGDRDVEVRIRDTGVGIPQDQLSRVFLPFYTTKEAGRGSGLGLVVARAIVNDHEGEIEVVSEPGQGTEFRTRFPASPS
ncbi:MAG TPA: protoglobin domain-containing protein [Bacteroidota bacterium]|nr:protoglobin domain-containing protein [Bacteroidota bacterium]